MHRTDTASLGSLSDGLRLVLEKYDVPGQLCVHLRPHHFGFLHLSPGLLALRLVALVKILPSFRQFAIGLWLSLLGILLVGLGLCHTGLLDVTPRPLADRLHIVGFWIGLLGEQLIYFGFSLPGVLLVHASSRAVRTLLAGLWYAATRVHVADP